MNDSDPGSSPPERGSAKGAHRAATERLDTLSETGWLSKQPNDFQMRILELGRWTTVPRGQRLYSAGDEPDALYGIGAGHLDLAIPILGGEECVIHRAGKGFWIGDGALPPDAPRTLSVEAATDCRLFRIPFPSLRRHLAKSPADWEYLHRLSTMNAILSVRILSETLSLSPRARVARLLLRTASPDGTVQATHEELGRLAGISRATFRRSLSRLIASGAIETRYNFLRIVDRSAVENEAGADES